MYLYLILVSLQGKCILYMFLWESHFMFLNWFPSGRHGRKIESFMCRLYPCVLYNQYILIVHFRHFHSKLIWNTLFLPIYFIDYGSQINHTKWKEQGELHRSMSWAVTQGPMIRGTARFTELWGQHLKTYNSIWTRRPTHFHSTLDPENYIANLGFMNLKKKCVAYKVGQSLLIKWVKVHEDRHFKEIPH